MLAVPHGHRDLVQNDNVEELTVVVKISMFVAVTDAMRSRKGKYEILSMPIDPFRRLPSVCAGGPSIHISSSFLDFPTNFHQLTWQTLDENDPKQANSDDLD
jgi:hypothetical protein